MGRRVSAVVTSGDRCVGAVGPFAVDVPWWAEVEPVVAHLRELLGVSAYVLRLLGVDGGDGARDGHVTYHVEAPGTTASLPAAAMFTGHDPLRAHWATASGLAELFDWARDAVGVPLTGPVEQRRTWNLAGLFRLPTRDGPVWLKALPPFAADEARVMALFAEVDPTLVPRVLAAAPGRLLLADVPGEDCWTAAPEVLRSGIRRFVHAQSVLDVPAWLRRTDPAADVAALLARADLGLTAEETVAAQGLSSRWAVLAECGLPTTVVHGDFHSGNWRSDAGGPPAVLDFADAHVGNPVLDGLRVIDFLAEESRPVARAAWVEAWLAERPGSEPDRALAVAEPLAHLNYAVRYQEFLDGIEESERIYHRGDPVSAVRAALAL
ncbi:aminoglycoside phosphotransferase family protein [Actinophytocola oryzae]|uniref:Phosphotransferase family enzyme n=1 Tax=Actinophytocola oryzae TaxID=502181 RepID=A0A4R7VZQ1_9PSEU|nr:aminoglycoside phosphotransferase family protein [Actinophytocola oryzae]TDV55148.1 phosphotransferase family enzyme [Actinophytocola oryzae]